MFARRLRGRVAVVTGVSSALGTRISEHLAKDAGMTVIGVSRRPPALPVASDIPPTTASHFYSVDLTDDAKTLEMVRFVKDTYGPISLLVHASGVNRNNLLLRSGRDTIEDVLNTNLTSPLLLTKHALRDGGLMKAHESTGCASVIFVGSTVGVYGNPGQIGYAASKGALDSICKSLAKEYSAKTGVRFNVVAPGLIDGPGMGASLRSEDQKHWADASCIRRLVTTDEVADGVLFLASNTSINAHTLVLDGGRQ
jgi:3-oxoacyl-[acyl-carrier protein] reductase